MQSVLVDFRISEEERCNLSKLGYEIVICPSSDILYEAVCGHPDMLVHVLNKENIVVHKNMDINFIKTLKSLNYNVILSHSEIQTSYPYDIILNSVRIGEYFIHNLKYTDKTLLDYYKDKKPINVKQGYTKCSIAVVSDNAIMTSDKNIAKALNIFGIDVLLLPCGDILLPGLDYGFIGGTCGLLDKNTLAFLGDLNLYAYGKEILEFLKKYNVEPVFLRKGKLIDRGSLFCI